MQPEIADRQVAGEVGISLFAAVNYARHWPNVQSKMVFESIDRKVYSPILPCGGAGGSAGFVWNEMSLATMDQLWEQVKEEEQADEEE